MVTLLPPGAPSDRSERKASPITCDIVLDSTAVVLTALRKISSVSGLLFLSEAATVGIRLVNLIKDIRDNNDAFWMLGLDAGKLVWTISAECERLAQTGKSVPPSVQDHISGLVTKLRSIETFIESKILRRKLQKIIAYSTDKSEVSRYREVLRTALDSFAIQASITSQEVLHHISEALDNQRIDVIFDRIHQTDTMNRLVQQQAEQTEQLRITVVSRYTEEDRLREEREYHARVEHEQRASLEALRAEQERQAQEDHLCQEKEKKEAAQALLRKRAAKRLKQMDREEAEKLEAKKRREQTREERETREAIAIVEMQERREAEQQETRRHKKRQEEVERQRQQKEEEELEAKKAAAARKEARIAAQEDEDAKEEARRHQQRNAEKQRRDEQEEYDEGPRRRPGPGKGTHISATQVEITLTRKKDGNTTKKAQKSAGDKHGTAHDHAEVAFDGEKFARDLKHKTKSEFGGFEDEFLDSSLDDDYWSDDSPRKRRAKSKKSAKAKARAGSPDPFIGVDTRRTGIQDMNMQHVHAYAGSHSTYYPLHHYGSPYDMMPPPVPYPYEYATSSNHANASNSSVRNVSNSAISFGDTPAVVRNSGNVRVVNISNVGNRYCKHFC